MRTLLDRPPYSTRDDAAFLEEMQRLTRHRLQGCPSYAPIWPSWREMEAMRVDRAEFDGALTRDLDPASRVIDYYGLVEQVRRDLSALRVRRAPRARMGRGAGARPLYSVLGGGPAGPNPANERTGPWRAVSFGAFRRHGPYCARRMQCGRSGKRFDCSVECLMRSCGAAPMCEPLSYFESAFGRTALALPFSHSQIIAEWSGLRGAMRGTVPAGFAATSGPTDGFPGAGKP